MAHYNAGIPFLNNLCPMARVSDQRGPINGS